MQRLSSFENEPFSESDSHPKRRKHSRSHRAIVPHLNHTSSRWALIPVMMVVWMAPFLGGSVEPWSMGVLFSLLALLFIAYPVTFGITHRYRAFLIVLLVLPLLAFLPVSLSGIPEWRIDLTERLGILFPKSITPQPWLTFDSYLAWIGGICWVYWLGGQGWTREIRKPLAELFAIGMIVLCIVGLIGYHTSRPLPFWHAQRLFGPFPNRNQTADLLSLTFVLLVALLHMSLVKRTRIAPIWIGGLLIVGYGLIVNFSRAGIILPAIGVSVYWVISTLTNPSRKKIWIGISSGVLALALLLAFGGETLDRLINGDNNQSMTDDFRQLIFRDTFAMTAQHPWFGLGLSSFASVFPLFRNLANVDNGIIHPESDWLWLASEIGWPGTIFILGGALWIVWRAFYASVKRPHPLRLASAICGGLFVLHGFFDVSGHRFGTFFPACFLFCLAWPGQLSARPISPKRSYGIAVFLFLIAASWYLNLNQTPLWPSRATLASIKKYAGLQIAHGHGPEAFKAVDAALRWAPLDWQLYYQRGTSRIIQRKDWADALLDYQRANFLERYSPITPDNEGLAWLSYRPDLAALSWSEALRRMSKEEGDRKYARYLVLAAPYPRLRSQLEAIAGNDIARVIVQMNYASPKDFPDLLAAFLRAHPQLDRLKPPDQRALFAVWIGKGNFTEAVAVLEKTPALLPTCNLPLASGYARMKKFQTAAELAFKTLPVPRVPKLENRKTEERLSQDFYSQNNLGTGIALYRLQLARRDNYGALSTLERLQTLPDAPLYLRYFQAELLAANGNWENAWTALDDYIIKSKL